jgi:hypothetical protein
MMEEDRKPEGKRDQEKGRKDRASHDARDEKGGDGEDKNTWDREAAKGEEPRSHGPVQEQGWGSKGWEASAGIKPLGEEKSTNQTKAQVSHDNKVVGFNGCNICGLWNHTAGECMRRPVCEICGFNNHSSYDCKREPLWNQGPELCAAQVIDHSFFFIEEKIDPRAYKEKASSAMITVIEGEANAKQIESEFMNIVDKNVWKWSARKIVENKYVMRFPEAKMMQVYSNFNFLGMKTSNAKIVVEPWSVAIGAKGELQQAWFRVRGIPFDQRSVKTVAKVGGLVGKTTTIDENTRLKEEFVRMRIARRDVTQVPATSESTLGLKIYDFHFEREVLDYMAKDSAKTVIKAGDPPSQPSPKKPKTMETMSGLGQKNANVSEGGGDSNMGSGSKGKNRARWVLRAIVGKRKMRQRL